MQVLLEITEYDLIFRYSGSVLDLQKLVRSLWIGGHDMGAVAPTP